MTCRVSTDNDRAHAKGSGVRSNIEIPEDRVEPVVIGPASAIRQDDAERKRSQSLCEWGLEPTTAMQPGDSCFGLGWKRQLRVSEDGCGASIEKYILESESLVACSCHVPLLLL